MNNSIVKKTLLILIVGIFILSGFGEAIETNLDKTEMKTQSDIDDTRGNTLITEHHHPPGASPGDIMEVDSDGNTIYKKFYSCFPEDVEKLNTGNILIVTSAFGHVFEVDENWDIVWELWELGEPYDAERLENDNTLITDANGGRVIEVNNAGTIIWEKTGLNWSTDAERLENGNTLITDCLNLRVIEIDNNGNIVWEKTGLNFPYDAERLENGNTLITEILGNRVIEVNNNGNIVWEKTGLYEPTDAERLENGNTLITENHQVIEVDSNGTIVWQKTGLENAVDAERLTLKQLLEINKPQRISFGKISSTVKNIGDDTAKNMNFSLFVEYGLLKKNKNNSIDIENFAKGESQTLEIDKLRGFGPTTITATAKADNAYEISSKIYGLIIGKFIFIPR